MRKRAARQVTCVAGLITVLLAAARIIQAQVPQAIVNGDFSAGLFGWRVFRSHPYRTVNVVSFDPPFSNVLEVKSAGSFSAGGESKGFQDIDIDVSLVASVVLEADVKARYASVIDGCGFGGTEMPVNLVLTYVDSAGATRSIIWGFYYDRGGTCGSPSPVPGREVITQEVPRNVWVHFASENIKGLAPAIRRLTEVAVIGSGWDYIGRADNIRLRLSGVCGNGVLEGEQCDDGNLDDGDGCDSRCILEECGNGITQAGEDCDGDDDAACPGACLPPDDPNQCKCPVCGDGRVNQPGEECDGSDLGACAEACNPPGHPAECRCAGARCGIADRPLVDGDFSVVARTGFLRWYWNDPSWMGSNDPSNPARLVGQGWQATTTFPNAHLSLEPLVPDGLGDVRDNVLRLERLGAGGWGGSHGVFQEIYLETPPGSELYLEADVKVDYQSLGGGGYHGWEYPVELDVHWTDTAGRYHLGFEQDEAGNWINLAVVQGFYYKLGNEVRDEYGQSQSIPQNQWVHFESVDLKAKFPTMARVDRISVASGGWDRIGYVDNVSLAVIKACGNGVLEGSEQCDDGNQENGDGCDSGCYFEVCGNGRVQAGEECDLRCGDTACTGRCLPAGDPNECKCPICGDGAVNQPSEECDGADADKCSFWCNPPGHPQECKCAGGQAECEFLVGSKARFGRRTTISGNVVVNDPRGSIVLGERAVMADWTAVFAHKVRGGRGSSLFDVFANDFKAGRNAEVRGTVGSPVPPRQDLFCPVPDISCGGPDVTVSRGRRTGPLKPGAYGKVVVEKAGTLTLQAGTFDFCALRVSRDAAVRAVGLNQSVLDVVGDLRIGNNAVLQAAPGTPIPAVNLGGGKLRVGAGAKVEAIISAPSARLTLGQKAEFGGTFCVQRADTGSDAMLRCLPGP